MSGKWNRSLGVANANYCKKYVPCHMNGKLRAFSAKRSKNSHFSGRGMKGRIDLSGPPLSPDLRTATSELVSWAVLSLVRVANDAIFEQLCM